MYDFITFTIPPNRLGKINVSDPQSPLTLNDFKPLIPDELKKCLEGKNLDHIPSSIVLMGVSCDRKPIGVSLASYSPTSKEFDIYRLNIDDEHLKTPLGVDFLKRMQDVGQLLGARSFYLTYEGEKPSTKTYEEIISLNQWTHTRPFKTICKYHMPTLNMPWIHTPFTYPEGFQEFLWKDLTKEDRKNLHQEERNRSFYEFVSPLVNEDKIEYINSLGIRFEGRVIGWMITHRLDKDTIRYESLFVEKGFEKFTLGPKLVAHSILLHLKSPVITSVFEIPLLHVKSKWKRFVERHLVPYADELKRLRLGWYDID